MRVRRVLQAGAVATAALGFGCAGDATPAANSGTAFDVPSASARVSQQSGVYVATVGGVALYSGAKGETKPECTLHTGSGVINGIGVDGHHVLWVPEAAAGGNGAVVLFAPTCGEPIQTIVDTDGQAAAIAFDRSGNAYIENVIGGNIDVYLAGHLSAPSALLVDLNAFRADGEAVDRAANVYMSYVTGPSQTTGTVAEFVGGQNPPIELGITTSGCPASMAVDSAGHLLVVQTACAPGAKNLIAVYKTPYGPTTKIASIHLKGPSFFCSLGSGGAQLYCSNPTSGAVDVYNYPAAKPGRTAYLYSWSVTGPSGFISGTAPDPPFVP